MPSAGGSATPERHCNNARFRKWLSKRGDGEIVEGRQGVRFGPKADEARPSQGAVFGLNDQFTVERDKEPRTLGLYFELVPGVLADLAVPAPELNAPPVLNVIEAHVVLQGVESGEIVVVLVLVPEDETSRLVDLAVDRLASYAYLEVLKLGALYDGYGKAIIGLVTIQLRKDGRTRGAGVVDRKQPLRGPTVSCASETEPRRGRLQTLLFKGPSTGRAAGGRGRRRHDRVWQARR